MANLAASGVTVERSWTEGGTNGRRYTAKQVTLVLNAMGSATNKVLASVLGFQYIAESGNFVADGDDVIFPTVPSYDGSELYFLVATNATDATRAAPADVTDTVRGVVKGFPA